MAEPNRVHQTVMGAYGNCQSACLAMVLGVPLSEIPNFAQLAQDIGDNEAYQAQAEWLRERGWGLLTVVKWQSLPWPPRHGYFIAGGVSPRGNRHAVIYKDGELWHDPHPEGGGIASVDDIDFLYPLRPFAVSETRTSDEPSELEVQAGAVVLATTPLIESPKFYGHSAWMGLSRAILEAAREIRGVEARRKT